MNIEFNKIIIKLASSFKILNWSYGEVKNSNFINFKNLKPEENGLFCLKIFSYYNLCCNKNKCLCNNKDKFINLKKSHLEYKIGHIRLHYPILHIWFNKTLPNSVSNILKLSNKIIDKIINFKLKIVIKSFLKNIKKYSILTYKIYKKNNFFSLSGNKAIKKLLSDNELLLDCKLIKKKLNKINSYFKLFYFLDKINKIYIFFLSGNKPIWLCIKILPVIPPKMRPLIPLSVNKFASSDLNELYKKIIDRNLRLEKLIYLGSPKQILCNERILLQESVDALFDNEKIKNPILTKSKRILKSFSNSIKGKYGRFRQNLLGKRVDFSGRTVISVEPNLLIFQCEIPILICLELFKPFIYYELKKIKKITTIGNIEEYYSNNKKNVILILNKIVKKFTILLNRAPTLHRMGIQSFQIILTQDKTIKIHPLLCLSYNADFDGDQMAVHLPLTIYSRLESKYLLLSLNNIISPSNGEPIITPTQDIIMGLYFLTYNFFNKDIIINNEDELNYYINKKNNNLNKNILFFYKKKKIKTTLGRYLLYYCFVKLINLKFLNKLFKKKDISYLIKYIYEFYGINITIKILEKLKKIGFYCSTIFGLTISYNDLITIKNNYIILKIIRKLKYNNNIFNVMNIIDKLFLNLILKNINYNKLNFKNNLNNVFIMLDSGSRGSMLQIKQLIAYRGFFSKSNGDIIIEPILENLKFGLTMKSYFISSFGSRKGLTDTSLKTANSGYLTRKLVDVMQDIVIYKINCFTKVGIEIILFYNNIKLLYKKIFGRVLLNSIYYKNKKILKKNTLINNKVIFLLIKKKIFSIIIRSVFFCIANRGICVSCYGIDLSNLKLVSIGIPVGVISAQSIGEPGTQLTMRTFHTGGVASFFYNSEYLVNSNYGFVKIKKSKCLLNNKKEIIILSMNCFIYIIYNNIIKESYKLSYGSKIYVRNNIFLKKNIKISNFDKNKFFIFSENCGYLMNNFILNKEYCYDDNKYYYKTKKNFFLNIKGKIEKNYFIPKNFFILIEKKSFILPGFIIAKIINIQKIKSSIIGGLPRLSELFEARIPKKKAIISEIDGIVNIKINYNLEYNIIIFSKFGFFKKYNLNCLRKLYINNGDYVKVGDVLSDGKFDLNEIINLIGIDYLIEYFINEVNGIYLPQGIYINEKHIELVLKQMTKKVKIIYSGECFFINNDILYLEDVLIENVLTLKSSKKISLYERIIIGITKSSLESTSFFSAASFQETTKILTDSAIRNRIDYLLGLKENVLVGRLIPAGTGLINFFYCYDKKYKNKNDVIKRKNLKLYLYSN